jgi:hypothetical protein
MASVSEKSLTTHGTADSCLDRRVRESRAWPRDPPKVDATELVDAVQALNPDRGLLVELVDVVLVAEEVHFTGVRLLLLYPVRVVRFVVEHEDVLFAANLAVEDSLHQSSVALDIPFARHEHAHEVAVVITLILFDVEEARRHLPVEVLLRQVASSPSGRRFRTNRDELRDHLAPTRLRYARGDATRLGAERFEDVPVGHEQMAARQVGHQVRRDEVGLAIQAGFAEPRIELREPAADRDIRADYQDDL